MSILNMTSDAKEDESGKDLVKDYKKKAPLNERKKDQCSFEEGDGSFVCVPSMKKLLAPLKGLPSDMVIK